MGIPKVMLINGNPLEAKGLRILMEGKAEIVNHATSERSVLEGLIDCPPEVVLLDADWSDLNPALITSKVRDLCPFAKVIWLVRNRDVNAELKALLAGADGCVGKTEADLLTKALKIVKDGQLFYSRGALTKFYREGLVLYPISGEKASLLTPREKEILTLAQQGKTDREIADILIISVETVKTHIKKIRKKLGLRRRRQIAYTRLMEEYETFD